MYRGSLFSTILGAWKKSYQLSLTHLVRFYQILPLVRTCIIIMFKYACRVEEPEHCYLLCTYMTLLKCEKYHQDYSYIFKESFISSDFLFKTLFGIIYKLLFQFLLIFLFWITISMHLFLMRSFFSDQFYKSLCQLS